MLSTMECHQIFYGYFLGWLSIFRLRVGNLPNQKLLNSTFLFGKIGSLESMEPGSVGQKLLRWIYLKHFYEKIRGLHIRRDDKNALSKDMNTNMATDSGSKLVQKQIWPVAENR